tara:strand:- start:31775 stop:32734 length:960 start_codon:yes stop_codon:yes gene_type:complete
MKEKDARIFVTSVGKASKRLEHYGDANLEGISLLKLIYKYACYSTTYKTLQRLNSMVSTLQLTDPLICMERQALQAYSSDIGKVGIVVIGPDSNTAPTITSTSISLDDSTYIYTFTYNDLFSGYNDEDGGVASNFVVNTLPSIGELFYDNVAAVVNTLYLDPTLLTYNRNVNTGISESFTFSAYDDDSQVPLVSNIVTCAVTAVEISVENEPATVGDTNIYEENRTTTVFTSADFTTNAIDEYSDPENDLLDAIKILEISAVNGGLYYYYGSVVTVDQIITREDLDAGAFYHTAADSSAITTDTISVAIRDEGSMIWVE